MWVLKIYIIWSIFCSTKPNQFQTLILDVEKGVSETLDNFDVFIRDYDEKKVSDYVGTLLDVSYLSKVTTNPTFPVIGKRILTNIILP